MTASNAGQAGALQRERLRNTSKRKDQIAQYFKEKGSDCAIFTAHEQFMYCACADPLNKRMEHLPRCSSSRGVG